MKSKFILRTTAFQIWQIWVRAVQLTLRTVQMLSDIVGLKLAKWWILRIDERLNK